MQAGGLKCPVEPRLRDDIWIKLMGNAALNPISASTRATMVEICQHPNTRRVVELMMEEALAIAARLGSHPAISITKRLDGAERVGHHKTSMLQDLEAAGNWSSTPSSALWSSLPTSPEPTRRPCAPCTPQHISSASRPALTAARA